MSEKKVNLRFSNKCSKCNTYMRVSLPNCPTCGEKINNFEKEQQEECSPSQTNFGEDDFLTCPSCRVVNSIEFEKCQTCGYKLFEPTKLKTANHA